MIKDGLIVINKPAGVTSHDVVENIRKIIKIKKVGHTGTLDPDATGVLILLIGKATKIAQFLQNDDKEYWAEMVLGIKTDTQDASGKVVFQAPCRLSEKEVRQALNNFKGKIFQTPPMVSAVKIKGRALYKLAREGKEVDRPSREITIHSIDFLKMESGPYPVVTFKVKCSKGTYIRTLCADVGDFLGCGARLKKLIRTSCGNYSLDDAHSIEEVKELASSSTINDHIILIQDALKQFPSITLKGSYVKDILNGRPLTDEMAEGQLKEIKKGQFIKVLDESKSLIAILKMVDDKKEGILARPIRVFVR
ncbi:tRNA pseudouridine(55) synthase TruB [Candidatus Oleimmundimicrobium sp.]|uniref:tRNA pseudouridine(55) synthase TruB n=1 Tax=Candidatus Oleimmundimicrobium sp. TaxID=3060597 RepID=UPI00272525E6|nr:tRNA pseudouridine(55) synthase TruB [Candidatus Oleimmundimicrobium sp.]MDO8885445.1 tRNA pseudouridine(55) synthase TruB [Candidatus Oleimmundimicrobium sp.]